MFLYSMRKDWKNRKVEKKNAATKIKPGTLEELAEVMKPVSRAINEEHWANFLNEESRP